MVLNDKVQSMQILGITGGIASDTGIVRHFLNMLGAPAVGADSFAMNLLDWWMPAKLAVMAEFPECVTWQGDGIDQTALRRVAAADPFVHERLEALKQQGLIALLKEQIEDWQSYPPARAAALEIPLLFESKLEYLVDKIVVVTYTEEKQLHRLLSPYREPEADRRIREADARQRIAAQWPLVDKIARADYVITTDGDRADIQRQVEALWEKL